MKLPINHIKLLPFICLIFLYHSLIAQEKLSLADAIRIGLENNYSIRLVKIEKQNAKIGNNAAAAGMLPNYSFNYTNDNQISDSHQEYLNGTKNDRNNAKSSQNNIALELSLTVFDGYKMFASKSRLSNIEKSSELKLQQQVSNSIARIIKAYLDIYIAQKNAEVFNNTLLLSQQRKEWVAIKYESGKSPKTELLQSKIDYNNDRYNYSTQLNQIKNSKLQLAQLLAFDTNKSFEIIDSIALISMNNLDDLFASLNQSNPSYLLAKKNQEINANLFQEVRSNQFPSIKLNAGYLSNFSQSQAGFLQSSNSLGPHYGFSIGLPLFNNWDISRKSSIAKLNISSAGIAAMDTLLRIQAQFKQLIDQYKTTQELFELEKDNASLAHENCEISFEQFKAGSITAIEFRQAQLNEQQSQLKVINAKYNLRILQSEMMRLSGK